MTVYVDEIQDSPPWRDKRQWPYPYYSHLWADTLEELHAFARQIGLRPEWFQDHATHKHYDLTSKRRQAARANGAIFMPAKEHARRDLERRKATEIGNKDRGVKDA